MCRSPTTPDAANPAPAPSTSTATSAPSRPAATPGYVGLEYIPDHDHDRQPRLAAPGESDPIVSTIAFIGLGIMGGPMSGHLVKAGHSDRLQSLSRSGGASGEAGGRGRRRVSPRPSARPT